MWTISVNFSSYLSGREFVMRGSIIAQVASSSSRSLPEPESELFLLFIHDFPKIEIV